jgi:hypothetical protein
MTARNDALHMLSLWSLWPLRSAAQHWRVAVAEEPGGGCLFRKRCAWWLHNAMR